MKTIVTQLRCEALATFTVFVVLYGQADGDWNTFALLFFVPDLSILLYLVNSRVGGMAYNAAHFYGFPVALFLFGLYLGTTEYTPFALLWAAHLSFDRMLGWGLKLEHSFFSTHLGERTIPGWKQSFG